MPENVRPTANARSNKCDDVFLLGGMTNLGRSGELIAHMKF